MQRFLRLAGFLGAAAGTEEEQAKNFQWGLRRSILNHLMCMSYTDVAQVANDARNYEILHERDDDDAERPDKWQKSGNWHQPTTQQSSYRSHCHNNDRHGSDRRGGSNNHRSSNNNYSGNNNRNSGNGRDQINRGQKSNRSANSGSQQSRGSSEGYSYPKDCKKNTTAGTSGQADKKPGASGRVFAITEDHATKTSEHHATIDCRSYRVIFGDIHAPEFIYHGSLPGKSMQIISALQARTLLSHGYEGFLATIHDTTSDVLSIHDQPIVSE
nr:zinc finger, CCHC-type, retrotransposon Gag domain protein [Tanacetum cinerariifolium]